MVFRSEGGSVEKGMHFNIPTKTGKVVEITIHPDHNAGCVLKKWPKSARLAEFEEAKKYLETTLENDIYFQKKLVREVGKAIEYASQHNSGWAKEFKFLQIALKNSFGL